MTAFQLAGVALAALLSENFILVNCLGIGTRTKAFQDPLDAWRTGVSLTAVMTLTALLSWLLDQLLQHFALGYFQTLVFALVGPAVVAGLRYFLKSCVPELSRRMDENLASITSNLRPWVRRCSSPSGGMAWGPPFSSDSSAAQGRRWL